MSMRTNRPRTSKEVVAAQDATETARLERGDHFVDPSVMPSMGRCRLTRIVTARVTGVSSTSTMKVAATSRSSPVLRQRGEHANTSSHSSLVAFVSNENTSRRSRSQMSDIPRGTIFGRRVGHQPISEAEHFIRCPAYGGGSEQNPIHISHRSLGPRRSYNHGSHCWVRGPDGRYGRLRSGLSALARRNYNAAAGR